jgi:hypothetical protein
MAVPVRRFGTGHTHTTVLYDEDGGYVWIRRPGPDRVDTGRPNHVLRQAIGFLHAGPVTLTKPESEGVDAESAAAVYRVGGRSVVADVLLDRAGDVDEILRNAAGALAAVHRTAMTGAEALLAPPGPLRLLAWLRTGEGPRSAARLHAEALSTMGRRRIATAIEWCAELVTERGGLLHGAPSTGQLVMAGQGGSGLLLIGEDLAVGPAEFDLGWLAGELVEHRGFRPHLDYDRLIAAFLGGYPSRVDLPLVGRAAAVRHLTHTRDFSAYVGWRDELLADLRRLADVVDAAERATLLPEVLPA